MNAATDPVVQSFRERIGALDDRILAAVNERLSLVSELHAHKEQNGLERVDRRREEELLRRLKEVNPGPLSEAGVVELFEFVLALVKQETAGV
ncbi:MAG TPA: chorismate mutase [Gaiellaceae bacterium]